MDPEAFKKIYLTIMKLSIVPWTIECVVNAAASHFLLGLPWMWGFLLGSIIAAISPAVVVPCLLRLRSKGYGVAKGIPTLIIAVAGIADACSVAAFGILSSIMFSHGSLAYQISQGLLNHDEISEFSYNYHFPFSSHFNSWWVRFRGSLG